MVQSNSKTKRKDAEVKISLALYITLSKKKVEDLNVESGEWRML